jgi:hypothetical protein
MIQKFSQFIFSTEDMHSRKMINSLIRLELLKSIKVPLSCTIYPENIKVIVIRVFRKTFSDNRSPIISCLIPKYLTIDRCKHVSAGEEKPEIVFGYFLNNRIATKTYVYYESFNFNFGFELFSWQFFYFNRHHLIIQI